MRVYLKLVGGFWWAWLFGGFMVAVAVIDQVWKHAPLLEDLDLSPWFWALLAAVGFIVAQLLAVRTLIRRGELLTDPDAPVARNVTIIEQQLIVLPPPADPKDPKD